MDEQPTDPKPAFHLQFTTAIQSLTDQITTLPNLRTGSSQQQDLISAILSKISALTHDLKDAANYLPGYDQRIYSEQLKATTDALNTARKASAPRTKFAFKARARGDASSSSSSSSTITTPTPPPPATASTPKQPSTTTTATTTTLSNLTSTRTHTPPATTDSTILSLSNLTSCIITPQSQSQSPQTNNNNNNNPFTTATITSITTSILIILPQISGPTHLTNLTSSILVISCHQFRLHDSKNLDIYLSCRGRPIIERCSNIRVARIPERWAHLRVDADGAGGEDRWDQVDDFNWLKEGRRSPNWRVMEEGEGVDEEGWGRVLEGVGGVEDEDLRRKLLPGL
ncbi:hypothetical protein TWF730_010366 [Orbilia blumenaviensis]|uniref:C-CAP/cofactor C-like domain-containing protein n=1 Tax=Orbilia blumenaviensis TaxID=1796055 RepID=A0AAV9UN19_9PEZI